MGGKKLIAKETMETSEEIRKEKIVASVKKENGTEKRRSELAWQWQASWQSVLFRAVPIKLDES